MPLLKYKAIDSRGKTQRGTLVASTTEDLESRLASMGLLLIRSESADKQDRTLHRGLFRREHVDRQTLILYCLYTEQLLRSGVAIPESIEELRLSIPHPRFRNVLTSLLEDIRSGKTLSTAMLAYPDIFPPMFSGLIQVGERTGKLADIFASLADNLKWEDELLAQTRRVLRYPLFVSVMVVGLFFFLMTYLAPRLVQFLPEMGAAMPFHTRLLLALSDLIAFWWPLLLVLPVVAYVGSNLACRISSTFHRKRDRLAMRLWFFGPLLHKIHLVRFANTFALMYRSGIPVLDTMEILSQLTGNKAVQETILQAKQMVSDGLAVSASFQKTSLFPDPIPRLLQVGEKAGQLDQALLNASYFLDRDVRERIGTVHALIEPVLTMFIGTLLAWIILSVLGPIYDVITHVSF